LVDDGQSPKVPFLTWDFQDEAILGLLESIGKSDVLVEKSRDMGASWMCVTVFVYCYYFRNHFSFLMTSRKEDLVDGDTDSLFAHVDFIRSGLPLWMRRHDRRKHLTLINDKTHSKIEGEATTGNIGRGGRRTAILIDEFAAYDINSSYEVLSATADNSKCRIFNSTPQGTSGAFYAQRESSTPRLRLHWSLHPLKRIGLYRPTGASYEIIDTDYWTPDRVKNYRFNTSKTRAEENVRSVWYDAEELRRSADIDVASQLDIDYQGSSAPFFDSLKIDRLRERYGVPAQKELSIDWNLSEMEPIVDVVREGPLKCWCEFDIENKPIINEPCVVGCDISQGTGASNSVASVVGRKNGTKYAEYATSHLHPEAFAELAIVICKLFSVVEPSILIWEVNGPGQSFTKRVVRQLKYPNLYMRREESRLTSKITEIPGWFSDRSSKFTLISNYRRMLFSEEFINPSIPALSETLEYVFGEGNTVVHSRSLIKTNLSASGESHGDRVIADALCCSMIKDHHKPERQDNNRDDLPPDMVHPCSMLARRRQHNAKEGRYERIW